MSLGDPEPNVRMASIYALTQIRGDLNSILPSLIKKLADSDAYVCRSAIGALAGFKADAHPALKSFKDHWLQFDGRNRSAAVFASARIDLKEAGPIMRLAMYDSDPRVQASFVRALSQCTNQPGIAVPFLIEFAHSTNTLLPDIQVARALANFGPEAKDAVPALLDMLKQTNSNQWAGIGEALSKIDAPAARNAGWTAQSPAAPRKRRGSP